MAPQRDEIFKQKVNDCVQRIILQKFTNFHAIRSWSFCNEVGWPIGPVFLRHPVVSLSFCFHLLSDYSSRRESREYSVHPRLSVCVSVCSHNATKTAETETTIAKLAAGIVRHESWLPT